METKWLFPHGENLTKTGHNNSSIEAFLDNIGKSLTREVIQNSLDAKNSLNDKPVIMEIKEFMVPTSDIPKISTIRDFALPRAKEMWRDYKETHEFLLEFEKVINKPKVPVLQISDYNTTGLNEENLESLIEGNSFSTKNNVDSAGSKGIGKAAPFAASDLRMVFYNSKSLENGIKSTGVINFVSFPYSSDNAKDITQERGILKTSNDGYLESQLTFGQRKREREYGTDLFLIGLKQLGDWKEKIIRAILNNFLVSIYKEELEVSVYGETINSESLGKIIESIDTDKLLRSEKMEFAATQNYYKVLTSSESIVLNLPQDLVEKYAFIKDVKDATLYLLNIEQANRKVLQTRKAGMKIYERGYINSIINFTGIFQATGTKLNEFLKDLENANHDKWSVDRKQGNNRTEAQNLLTDLLRWFRSEVKSNYGVTTEEINDAIGVSDLLPIVDSDNDNKENKDSGIKNKFTGSKIKEPRKNTLINDGEKEEEDLRKALEDIGISDSENGSVGPGSSREGKGGGNNPDNEFGTGGKDGDFEPDDKSDKRVVTEVQKPIGKGDMNAKLIGLNYKAGKYKLVGKANKKFDKLAIHFKSVGDNGSTYKVKVLDSHSGLHDTTHTSKEIILNKINRNDLIDITFDIDTKLKLKMEVIINEIKN